MTLQFQTYSRNLAKTNEENMFLLPWGGLVLRNCDELGDLLHFQSVAHYRESSRPLWLILSLVIFRENVSFDYLE
jgi:hypothetical protein